MLDLNARMQKLKWWDVGLIKLSAFFFALAFMYWVPQVHDYGWETYLILTAIFAAVPIYHFWIKK
ncbi:hypothetical protein HOD83_02830 [Candidatus Woesearchaeota archaeon]|jgi:hypothetical protein|nr:hypothetical protein [Candidatus Woesearchaeota archaeon]MBT4114615.1 hypothetical protein [Candidatus Woesearchaeota archaeon]MBT4248501.1 hypothetical protein [Candidatus Woesearchaeota archaeon]